jgi:hypothetical protein
MMKQFLAAIFICLLCVIVVGIMLFIYAQPGSGFH